MHDDLEHLDEQVLDAWEVEPPPPPARVRRPGFALPLLTILAGLVAILLADTIESRASERQLWGDAILFAGDTPPAPEDENLVPVMLQHLPEPRSRWLDLLEQQRNGPEAIKKLHLDFGEWAVLLPVTDDALLAMLESGRLPARGRFEALAGDMARGASFELGGHEFEVVGRLQRGVGGLSFAFIVPDDEAYRPLFEPDSGGSRGWLDIIGRVRYADMTIEEAGQLPETLVAATRARGGVAAATLLGLMLIALGGSLLYYRIFVGLADRRCGGRRVRAAQSLLEDVRDRRGLFVGMHVLLYGAFFLMMLLAILFPVTGMRFAQFLNGELLEGSLSHIGDAYSSGNVVRAATVTFMHNYFLATILWTIAFSLIIPFGGVIKNLLTFVVVGFAMAPVWTGVASGMFLHSITMAIELGAYIVASFAVALLPIRVVAGISKGEFGPQLLRGLQSVGGAALVTGAMLAFAAVYEAVTLILMR